MRKACLLLTVCIVLPGLAQAQPRDWLRRDPMVHRELDPCRRPELWPHSIASRRLPIRVHYQRPAHEPVARASLRHLERAWRIQVRLHGWRQPPSDRGVCGPDGDLDVWLWRGLGEAYVASEQDHPATPWNDALVTMVVDPWGPFGREFLASTLAHELNHVFQAAEDWWEHPAVFEMTAQFVEWVVAGNDEVYRDVLRDFQARPEWAVDYNDDYATYFMYGAALYLHYLRDRHFGGEAAFASEMWRRSRSAPGAELDPLLNEPDFEDALDQMLGSREPGLRFIDTLPEFARWRWYTGPRQDRRHFVGTVRIPAVSHAARVELSREAREVELRPMPMGSSYVEVRGGRPGLRGFWVGLEPDPGAEDLRWVVQAVPGLTGASDGEVLDLTSGRAWVRLPPEGRRTLIVTVLTEADPDERDLLPRRRARAVLALSPR